MERDEIGRETLWMSKNEDDGSPLDKSGDAPFMLDRSRSRAQQARYGKPLNVSLDCIEAFVVAAECTSLAEAAAQCGEEESTFRKRINALEKWASAALFQRSPDLLLTTEGSRFLPLAQLACKAVREFGDKRTSFQLQTEVRGRVVRPPTGGIKRKCVDGETFFEVD